MLSNAQVLPFLKLTRIPAVFSAMSNILAAYLIVAHNNIDLLVLGALLLSSSCLYLGGMVLNDFYDIEEDQRERPQRPIPSGQVSLKVAGSLGYLLLIIGVIFAATVGSTQLIIALVLALFIVIYDKSKKSNYSSAFLMGSCRGLNWLLGLSAAALEVNTILLILPIFLYITGLTLLSKVETNASSRTPLVHCFFYITLSLACTILLITGKVLPNSWAILLLGIGASFVFIRLIKTWNNFTPQNIQKSIMILLMGVIPYDAVLAFSGAPWWGGVLVALLWFPGRILSRKIYIT